jgi:DNA-binding response OmpR family regulator
MGDRAPLSGVSQTATGPDSLVVLVAGSVEDRLRVVSQLGDDTPLLVVSTAQEAAAFLAGTDTSEGGGQRTQGRPADMPAHAPAPTVASRRRENDLRLLEDRRAVAVGTTEVSLTPLEYGVLAALLTGRGRVRSFADLSREVWGTSHVGDGAQVHAVVKRLRRKLAAAEAPVGIEVVRGIGFRAVPRRKLEAVSTAIST